MSFYDILNWFPNSAGWMLVIAGLLALTWLGYETKRGMGFFKRKKEDWEIVNVTKFLRLLSYSGLVLGVIMIWGAIMGIMNDLPPTTIGWQGSGYDKLTSYSLIVIGIICFLKPINDLPWSSIIGLLVAILSGILMAIFIPDQYLANPETKWIIIVVSIIIAGIVASSVKFYVDLLQGISKVLSWPPFALLIAAYCFIQGFMIIFAGQGLAQLF